MSREHNFKITYYSVKDTFILHIGVSAMKVSVGFSSICDVAALAKPAIRRVVAIFTKHVTNITKRKKLEHAIPTAILFKCSVKK